MKRFLKGKKVIRVKRGDSTESLTHMVADKGNANGGTNGSETASSRKVIRVKVKRKPTSSTTTSSSAVTDTTDVDSMAPPGALMGTTTGTGTGTNRGLRGGPLKSDRSIGALSKARSWFTFGGMKVRGGRGGTDSSPFGLDYDDEDDDEQEEEEEDQLDEEEITQVVGHDHHDEENIQSITDPKDEVTNSKEELSQSPVVVQTRKLVQDETKQQQTPIAATATATTTPNIAMVSPKQPQKQSVVPSKTPTTPKSQRSGTSKSKQTKSSSGPGKPGSPPSKDIIVNAIPPRRQPLTGVALRRLKIQERWLSKGCNYHPNEYLIKAFRSSKEDDPPEEVSEISYDDPVCLVMGPDATPASEDETAEVNFWTQTCDQYEHGRYYGLQHSRTAEAFLNKGIAQLNTRHVADAIDSFLEAVAMTQEIHGDDSLAAARGLHLLGSAFFLDGQLETAAEATLKALQVRQTALGPFHTDTVDTFSNLAMIYLKMSHLVEAARIFQEVLTIRIAIYHDLHPSVAFPARSLGCVYAKRRDIERAVRHYTHALRCFDHYDMVQERRDTLTEMRRLGLPAPVDSLLHNHKTSGGSSSS
jgi:tetratricopeptide (TPR) repeat protein